MTGPAKPERVVQIPFSLDELDELLRLTTAARHAQRPNSEHAQFLMALRTKLHAYREAKGEGTGDV